MTKGEHALLIALAKLIQDDPNLCARMIETLHWEDPRLEKRGSASEKGWEIIGDLIDEAEKPDA